MRKLPKGKSGGPDEMTYEMWQEAPDPMQELLWRSVNTVLAGSQLPEEWAGAFTKLIVKKIGAEGDDDVFYLFLQKQNIVLNGRSI